MIYTNNSVVLCKYIRVHAEIEAHTASFYFARKENNR